MPHNLLTTLISTSALQRGLVTFIWVHIGPMGHYCGFLIICSFLPKIAPSYVMAYENGVKHICYIF